MAAACKAIVRCLPKLYHFKKISTPIFEAMKPIFLAGITLFLAVSGAFAQDTLPHFSVVSVGEYKVRVSWTNPFGQKLIQINVQRSFDSTRNFQTIFSPASPALPQNGYIDDEAYGRPLFYRIFYVFQDGEYFFTQSSQPHGSVYDEIVEPKPVEVVAEKEISVYFGDSLLATLPYSAYMQFRDSIALKTKDTLFAKGPDKVVLKPFLVREIWKASPYVHTNKRGYLDIVLPDAGRKKYRLKITNETNELLFDIQQINEPFLTLDKANFMRAGWYFFELYEEGKLKEKNKFYLWKDF